MPKKRTRYSSNFADDWLLSTSQVEEKSSPDGKSTAEEGVQAADRNNDLPETPHSTQSDRRRKASRYKTTLPLDWVDTQSDPNAFTANHTRLAMRVQAQETENQVRFEPVRLGSGGYPMNRSNWIVYQNEPTISRTGSKDYHNPPPAPTTEQFQYPFQSFHTDRRLAGQTYQGRSEAESETRSKDSMSNAHDQRRSQLTMHPHETCGSTISPPVSVSQQSSAATTSPYYGRDLPAKGPSISPTYSVV